MSLPPEYLIVQLGPLSNAPALVQFCFSNGMPNVGFCRGDIRVNPNVTLTRIRNVGHMMGLRSSTALSPPLGMLGEMGVHMGAHFLPPTPPPLQHSLFPPFPPLPLLHPHQLSPPTTSLHPLHSTTPVADEAATTKAVEVEPTTLVLEPVDDEEEDEDHLMIDEPEYSGVTVKEECVDDSYEAALSASSSSILLTDETLMRSQESESKEDEKEGEEDVKPTVTVSVSIAASSTPLVLLPVCDEDCGEADGGETLPSDTPPDILNMIVCKMCGQCIASSFYYKHALRHYPDRPFACPAPGCHYDAKQRGSVQNHIQSAHSVYAAVYVKPDAQPLSRTLRACFDGYAHLDLDKHGPWADHDPNDKNDKRIRCKLCDASFDHQSRIYQHVMKHLPLSHPPPFKCAQCQYAHTMRSEVSNHMMKYGHMGDVVDRRDREVYRGLLRQCFGDKFGSRSDRGQTSTKHPHHKTSQPPVRCKLCSDMVVYHRNSMRAHVRLRHKSETYAKRHTCTHDGCHFTSDYTAPLRAHMLSAHGLVMVGNTTTRRLDEQVNSGELQLMHQCFGKQHTPASCYQQVSVRGDTGGKRHNQQFVSEKLWKRPFLMISYNGCQ